MRLFRFFPALTGVALVVGACGDSTGTGNEVELSEAEAMELFTAVQVVIGNLDFSFHAAAPLAPGLNLSVAGEPINESATCDEGGSVTLDGDIDGDDNGGSFDMTLGFNNCGSEGYTIDGDLDYQGSGDLSGVEFTIKGTLAVETPEGLSGDCTFDIEASVDDDSARIEGTVCGQPIDDEESF